MKQDKLALVHPIIRNYVLALAKADPLYDQEEAQIEKEVSDRFHIHQAEVRRETKLARRRKAWTGGYVHEATA